MTARVTDSTGQYREAADTATITDPVPPVLLGHWRNRPADAGLGWRARMDATEVQFGRFAGPWRDFKGIGSPGKLSAENKQAVADGRTLLINMKLRASGQTWADVAGGARDSVIAAAAQDWQSVAVSRPAGTLRATPEHEPEDELGAAGSGMTAADYRAMWQRWSGLWRTWAPDVQQVWTCQGWDQAKAASCWPGAGYADILGHDPYEKAPEPPPDLADRIVTRSIALRQLLAGAAGLPVICPEYGPDLGGGSGDRGTDLHRAQAIDGIRARLPEIAAAGVVAICYFDAGTDWITEGGPDAAAYAALKTATES